MDTQLVENLVKLLQGSSADELKVTVNGLSVQIKRGYLEETEPDFDAAEALPDTASGDAEGQPPGVLPVNAGMVGIFRQADPETIKAGAVVKQGQVVGHIESMKLMNDVRALDGGVVDQVLVDDGSPVEYGQILFTMKKDS